MSGVVLITAARVEDRRHLVGRIALQDGGMLAVNGHGSKTFDVVRKRDVDTVTILDEEGLDSLTAWLSTDPDIDPARRQDAADDVLDHLLDGQPAVKPPDHPRAGLWPPHLPDQAVERLRVDAPFRTGRGSPKAAS